MTRPPVEEELAIRELYARYCWALDTGDTDGYCALFTRDAEATEETASGELEVHPRTPHPFEKAPLDRIARSVGEFFA